jgi:hypothetical protein
MFTPRLVTLLCLVLLSIPAWAQQQKTHFSLGYFAPHAVQMGAKLGASFAVLEKESQKLTFRAEPQLAYFVQPHVRQNAMLGGRLACERVGQKRFSPYLALGANYLFTTQRKEATVNLGSGEIEFHSEQRHHFLPVLSLGAKLRPQKHLGFYAEAFFGRNFTQAEANSGFFGAELGILWTFTKTQNAE